MQLLIRTLGYEIFSPKSVSIRLKSKIFDIIKNSNTIIHRDSKVFMPQEAVLDKKIMVSLHGLRKHKIAALMSLGHFNLFWMTNHNKILNSITKNIFNFHNF